jgi:hypothetical protein
MVVAVGRVQAGQSVTSNALSQLPADTADGAVTWLGCHVYVLPGGHEQLRQVVHDG